MVTDMFQTPRLERTAEGAIFVTRWGRVGGHLLRAGDRLVLGAAHQDELLVLIPRGYGRPMLGRRGNAGLLAEPSGVPASGLRWEVGGAVVAIERDLERGGVGVGNTHVVCRVEGSDIASLARARAIFADGVRTERELIHLCSQAAVAPEEHGIQVAIAAADSREQALALLARVGSGSIRFALPDLEPQREQRGMVVPGPWRAQLPSSEIQLDFEDIYDSPAPASQSAEDAAEHGGQLSLFGQEKVTA
jgi:hypothetical protein